MKKFISLLAVIVAIGYPLMVFFGIDKFGPRGLAVVLLAFSLLRFALARQRNYKQTLGFLIIIGFCIVTMIVESERLLRFYPVLLSLGIASVFFFSLWDEKPLIQRIAETTQGDHERAPIAYRYMRNLTGCWAGFLSLNALIAAYTAVFLSLKHWALYNSLISYILIGIFIVVESLYRRQFKRKHNIV